MSVDLAGVASMLFDGDWYNSPFIVPVAGCAMIGSIVVAGIWSGVRTREIRSHERLARIAQGLPVEPDMDDAVASAMMSKSGSGANFGGSGPRWPTDGGNARRAGIVLVSIGLGLMGFFVLLALLVRTTEVLIPAAAGLIPFAIGVGFLVDARLKRKEFEQHREWHRFSGMGMGPADPVMSTPPPPPPPPEGMSAAQASDWRPLH